MSGFDNKAKCLTNLNLTIGYKHYIFILKISLYFSIMNIRLIYFLIVNVKVY